MLERLLSEKLVSIPARPESRALPLDQWLSLRPLQRFNPRPARKPGATRTKLRYRFDFGCFNPRPARKPGATPLWIERAVPLIQFQSPPGPKAGRYASFGGRVALPGPKAGRYHARFWFVEFQSPPGPKAGRYYALLIYKLKLTDMFQSPPGPKAGRYSACARSLLALSQVSIPARPESRALPEGAGMNGYLRFQSPPGPKAGRYQQAQESLSQHHAHVSIPARPESRALQWLRNLIDAGHLPFQSPPGPKAGRYQQAQDRSVSDHAHVSIPARPESRALQWLSQLDRRSWAHRFNPRPARKPGATWKSLRPRPNPRVADQDGFNPRPARKPGATSFTLAIQSPPGRGVAGAMFQSPPGPKAGRYVLSAIRSPAERMFSFNPRPARKPGATMPNLVSMGKALLRMYMFQSPPGPKAGRYLTPASARVPKVATCFNPRPARKPGATWAIAGISIPAVVLHTKFQSPPGPKAGRYGQATRQLARQEAVRVSIPARPESRALPVESMPAIRRIQSTVSIPARPESRALRRCSAREAEHLLKSFQSPPGPKAGRYQFLIRQIPSIARTSVSIPARPESRALHGT